MMVSKKNILLAFLVFSVYALGINEWNIHTVRISNPDNKEGNARSLVYNSTLYSIDNYWYVSQIKNYTSGKGFTVDADKHNYTVRRTPLYPLFYGIHYLVFGEKGSYFFIRYTQIILYALAAIALFFATFNFTGNKKMAVIAAALYGFNPTLVCYLYLTITEAVSPSLVCFFLYFLSRCKKYGRNKDWITAGLFFAIGSLCRPPLFILGGSVVFLILYLYRLQWKRIFYSALFFGIGISFLFVPHVIRNFIVTKGEIIVLEKYYNDPMDFGMPNIKFRNWISCWINPADYSSETVSNKMILNILSAAPKTKEEVITAEINTLPKVAFAASTEKEVYAAYEGMYEYYEAKHTNQKSTTIDSLEVLALQKTDLILQEFKQKKPVRYYLITPLLIIKSVVVQSNASVICLLDDYRQHPVKMLVKFMLLLLNILLFISVIGNLFFLRRHLAIYGIVVLFVLVNTLFITYYYRYLEARYLIPLFPGLYLLFAIFLVESVNRLKQRSGL